MDLRNAVWRNTPPGLPPYFQQPPLAALESKIRGSAVGCVPVHLNATQERWVRSKIIEKRGDKFTVDLAREATCR